MKSLRVFAFLFLIPMILSAAIGDNGISVAPDGTTLKWENGAWDFFIMHKSLIGQVTGAATTNTSNPQADTFIDHSTYTLTSKHIPPDANIDRAFLVWLSTQDPDNLAGNTDNSVLLTFTNALDSQLTFTKEVTASFQGNLASTTIGDFEYEALNMQDSSTGDTGVYTYRVEVSDFMKEIIEKGKEKGMTSGEALYGDYTVSCMDGSNHQNYLNTSGLVGGWFLPFVYSSSHINAKNVYFYNGLSAYQNTSTIINVSGFELPENALIKLGFVAFEGDPGLYSATLPNMEGLSISGMTNPENFAPIFNNCNPAMTNYTEMFNSISSVFGWADSEDYWCIGNPNYPSDSTSPIEYAIDADILVVDTSPEGPFEDRFTKGDNRFNLKIGANQDQVYTNFLAVSIDTQKEWSDTDTDTSDTDSADSADSADSGTNDTANTGSADSDSNSGSSDDSTDSDNNENSENWGELGGKCYPNKTCNDGLACDKKKDICIEPVKIKSSGGCALLSI